MKEQTLKNEVSRQLARLQSLPEHPQKAALADLRRGIGHAPGDLPKLWGSFLLDMPEEMQSKTGQPTRAEWAVYLALTLYALHQQGHSLPNDCMHTKGAGLGQAVRKLVKPGENPEESSILKRFNALATSESVSELSHHLRGMVQLLRANGIPLDYIQLAADLYELQFTESAPRVRLRWGQDFYAVPKNKDQSEK